MSKLFNFLAYGVGFGATLYTMYDKVYYEDGALDLWFKVGVLIVVVIAWRRFHKFINQQAQIQKNNMLIYVDRFPTGKNIYMFSIIIGALHLFAGILRYVEQRDIPLSFTFEMLRTAWIIALGLKLISVGLEKRKQNKIDILKEKESN